MLAENVIFNILSSKPFPALSAFSLPGIPVWSDILLIFGFCVNLDAVSLMDLVVVLISVG